MATVSKRVARLAAQIAADRPEMDAAATKVAAAVRAEAAPHRDTGSFIGSIHVVRGRTDRHVTTSDPLALHKEFGHLQVSERNQEARWIKGIFVFTNAAKRVAS